MCEGLEITELFTILLEDFLAYILCTVYIRVPMWIITITTLLGFSTGASLQMFKFSISEGEQDES